MDTLMALAVSIGVLIALWVKFGGLLAPGLAIAVPTGIVAWACFFAAGGKVQGLQKAIAANLSGVIWVGIAMTLIGATGTSNLAFIFIGIVAFLIVIQSKIALVSFIPGDLRRSEEHTSELQSLAYLVCRLLLEKKKKK